MYLCEHCPCCGSDRFHRFPAVVAPFIAAYALNGDAPSANLLECRECSHRYFDQRFDEIEMAHLYQRYRSEEYFRCRHGYEPWYSKSINEGIGGDPLSIADRKKHLRHFMGDQAKSMFRSILDYGGDRGQFIPEGMASLNYVFEMSDAEPIHGVNKLTSKEELAEHHPFSLILMCHVLEHLPEPEQAIREVRDLLEADSGLLLIEVPNERYKLMNSIGGELATRLSAYSGWLRMMLEVYTLGCRTLMGVIPPLGLSRLHEHVNFFSIRSLEFLLRRCGFVVIKQQSICFKSKTGVSSSLLILARAA